MSMTLGMRCAGNCSASRSHEFAAMAPARANESDFIKRQLLYICLAYRNVSIISRQIRLWVFCRCLHEYAEGKKWMFSTSSTASMCARCAGAGTRSGCRRLRNGSIVMHCAAIRWTGCSGLRQGVENGVCLFITSISSAANCSWLHVTLHQQTIV